MKWRRGRRGRRRSRINIAERAVRLVLKWFKNNGQIKYWKNSARSSGQDHDGIDFTICLIDGSKTFLQVKFHPQGDDQRLIEGYLRKHPFALYNGGSYEQLLKDDHLRKHPKITNIIIVRYYEIPASPDDWKKIRRLGNRLAKIIF